MAIAAGAHRFLRPLGGLKLTEMLMFSAVSVWGLQIASSTQENERPIFPGLASWANAQLVDYEQQVRKENFMEMIRKKEEDKVLADQISTVETLDLRIGQMDYALYYQEAKIEQDFWKLVRFHRRDRCIPKHKEDCLKCVSEQCAEYSKRSCNESLTSAEVSGYLNKYMLDVDSQRQPPIMFQGQQFEGEVGNPDCAVLANNMTLCIQFTQLCGQNNCSYDDIESKCPEYGELIEQKKSDEQKLIDLKQDLENYKVAYKENREKLYDIVEDTLSDLGWVGPFMGLEGWKRIQDGEMSIRSVHYNRSSLVGEEFMDYELSRMDVHMRLFNRTVIFDAAHYTDYVSAAFSDTVFLAAKNYLDTVDARPFLSRDYVIRITRELYCQGGFNVFC